MATGHHDQLLMTLTAQHESIDGLLDTFFDFLHRKTDFYVVTQDPAKRQMGFVPGQAEAKVLAAFRKYPMKQADVPASRTERTMTETTRPSRDAPSTGADRVEQDCPVVQDTSHRSLRHESTALDDLMKKVELTDTGKQVPIANGGVTSRYTWTQSLDDVMIHIPVPDGTRSKDVACRITATTLSVALCTGGKEEEEYRVIVDGALPGRVRVDDSLWSLESNRLIQVSLEKVQRTWWASAVVGDAEIDTTRVDSTMAIHEYDEQTQAAIRKAMFDQSQKSQGLPTSDELEMEKLLAKARDLPGSPFRESVEPSTTSQPSP